MMRSKAAVLVALIGFAAVAPLGRVVAAWGAPPPVNAGPTALHPVQGLRRITVATVPPIPGVKFALDGQQFTADARGVASILVTTAQREAMKADREAHLTVVTPQFNSTPGVRAQFTGWSGPGQYRQGSPPEDYQRATFDIQYLTSFKFATTAGVSVAGKSLTSMELTSSLGDRIRMRPNESRWLQGSRTATGALGLQSQAVSYRIDSVTKSGENVVNRGQQQFFPSRQQHVNVFVLFFDVQFGAQDALLGSSVGSSIVLEYPDGHQLTLPFGPDGTVTARHLPRGTYHVTVRGAGPAMSQKLTISKSQRADFDAVTWIDLALAGALVLVIVVGLFSVRRWVRLRNARLEVTTIGRAEADRELVGAP